MSVYLCRPHMFVTDNVALSINLLSLSVNRCWLQVCDHDKAVPLCDIGLCSGEGILLPTQSRPNSKSRQKSEEFFSLLFTVSTVLLLYTVIEKGGKPDRKPYPLPNGFRNPDRNFRSENFQDYAQKPQRNCRFMNLASDLFSLCCSDFIRCVQEVFFILIIFISLQCNSDLLVLYQLSDVWLSVVQCWF